MPIKRPLAERFWEKVDKNGPVPPHQKNIGRCWIWLSSTDKDGYGTIWLNEEIRATRATHVSWKLHFDAVPKGAWVLHRCDNPSCVRPSHLWLGNAKDNAVDREQKGRGAKVGYCMGVGLKSTNPLFTESQIKTIRFLFLEKYWTLEKIANKYAVTQRTISLICRGISYSDIPCFGLKDNYAERARESTRRFTVAQVREMRRLHKNGLYQHEIASKFKLTQSNVSAIIRRQSYSHVN